MNEITLPITALKPQFHNALEAGPVVVVAPTGSGKSTQIPTWCPEPVLVVEPRRVACRSLARWLAQQRSESLGQSVGYTVRFEDVSSAETRIRFVTPGVALRYAAGEELSRYPTIILDEFHERGVEADLFLSICRKRRADANLVIMSATIAAHQLARFIGGTVLRAEGRVYPVTVKYLGGTVVPSSRDLMARVERGIHRALRETTGNVLVFLPGKGEISSCHDALRRLRDVELIPLHGTLPMGEQDRAFETQSQRRRVILATNVAETSITLPGITAVVDAGLVRQRIHQSQRIVLALRPISQASAEQRRGRAGRLRPGICYRLWEEQGQLEPETLPEIRREDLTQFVLDVAATGYRPQDLPFLDAPPDFAVARAQTELKSWGVLSEKGILTEYGARLCALPVAPLYARLLVKAPPALRPALIALVATLERPAPLWRRVDEHRVDEQREAILEARRKELFRGDACDATAAIRTLRHGDVKRHHLHANALAECRRIATQLRAFFELPSQVKGDKKEAGLQTPPTGPHKEAGLQTSPTGPHKEAGLQTPPTGPHKEAGLQTSPTGPHKEAGLQTSPTEPHPDRTALIDYLLREWPECAYVRRQKGKGWGNGQAEVLLDSDSLVPKERHAALILETVGIAKGTRVQLMGRTAMPCTFKTLVKAGIGTSEVATPKLVGTTIVAEVVTTYAGREIGREQQPLRGELLRAALATLILSGKRFRGIGEHLTRAMNAWHLHRALNSAVMEEITPHAWLVSRLTELGVEEAEDCELLAAEDLTFTEIDETTLAEIEAQYPREFAVNGAKFRVDYQPAEKQVTLVWLSGIRQPTLSPVLLPRWNHWKVQLNLRGTLRTVRQKG